MEVKPPTTIEEQIEKLKKALKLNGHRLNRIISVEVTNNPTSVMSDIQNGISLKKIKEDKL